MNNSRKSLRITLAALGALALLLIVLYCAYGSWEQPPAVGGERVETGSLDSAAPSVFIPAVTEEPLEIGLAPDTARQDGVYTLLLAGDDSATGNTDTIMAGRIDTVNHRMDFVSIPRDTLINVDWSVRKLNSVYWGSRNNGGNGHDALLMQTKRLLGFAPDCYAVLNLSDFVEAVDLMGGVWFDVPIAMHYEDGAGLAIHLEPGYQHLDGEQAMGVVRFRSGYLTGDLGRIEMQHQFLSACFEQFIRLGNLPNASRVVKLLTAGMDTDLRAANLAFFLRQALQCRSEDIHFHTAPCDPVFLQGYSYAVLRSEEWLQLVNEALNPFAESVRLRDMDIVYQSGNGYAGTHGLQGAWYYETPPEPEAAPEPPTEEPSAGPVIIIVTPEPEESPLPPGEDGPDEEPPEMPPPEEVHYE